MTQISIYIITVKDTRNYDSLVGSLIQHFGFTPSIVWGITPKDLPCANTGTHLHEGRYRQLSCHEVAAALSHARAREMAISEGGEWAIFLEDDSELIQNDNLDFISNLLRLPGEIPFFVHLFPEQNGILSSSRITGMNTIRKMPDYANAYALNTQGLRSLLKNTNRSHLYLADWPKFSRRIKKIAPTRSIFRHPLQSIDSSLISTEREGIHASQMAFRLNYRFKQVIFKIFRIPFARFGHEDIASENLRSVTWW